MMKDVTYILFANHDAFTFPMDDYFKPQVLSQEEKKTYTWQELWDALNQEGTPFTLFSANKEIVKSPDGQQGRDFGFLLAGLAALDYSAQWRMDQDNVYIFAYKNGSAYGKYMMTLSWDEILYQEGLLVKLFPVKNDEFAVFSYKKTNYKLIPTLFQTFTFRFANAGFMAEGEIYTAMVTPKAKNKEDRTMKQIIQAVFEDTI